MTHLKLFIFTLLTSVFTLPAVAHPGHEHFTFKSIEHYIVIAFVILAVIIGTVIFPQMINKKIANQLEENK